jgi:hypothetical protein
MIQWLAHLKTINHHRALVRRYCFKLGLYRQGLTHDLSKYSPTEFLPGARYYQGDRSPNDREREILGYSAAWLHHKGRNRHHLEYWTDYAPGGKSGLAGIEMPARYVAEMLCDRIAASRTYRGPLYSDRDPYDYYMRSVKHYLLHPRTRALLERLLGMLKDRGEAETFAYIRREVLGRRK